MDKIIEKAIKHGGYDPSHILGFSSTESKNDMFEYPSIQARFVLDPLFWQSLGKACGWRDFVYSYYISRPFGMGYWKVVDRLEEVPEDFIEQKKKFPGAHWYRTHLMDNPQSFFNAQKFYEINLTQGWGKAIEWLSNLIEN